MTPPSQDFRRHFEQYGALTDSIVMMDRATNRSRGFGFVTFALEESANACMAARHQLHGKYVDVKRAEPGPNEGGGPLPPPMAMAMGGPFARGPPFGGGGGGHYGPG